MLHSQLYVDSSRILAATVSSGESHQPWRPLRISQWPRHRYCKSRRQCRSLEAVGVQCCVCRKRWHLYGFSLVPWRLPRYQAIEAASAGATELKKSDAALGATPAFESKLLHRCVPICVWALALQCPDEKEQLEHCSEDVSLAKRISRSTTIARRTRAHREGFVWGDRLLRRHFAAAFSRWTPTVCAVRIHGEG